MKTKILVLILSVSLLFSGCASKSINLDNTVQTEGISQVRESSLGEKVVVGTLLAGAAVLYLTAAAVAILLLVPKGYEPR